MKDSTKLLCDPSAVWGQKIVSFLETCTYMCHQSGLINMNKSLDIVNIILTLLFWSKFRQNRGTSS